MSSDREWTSVPPKKDGWYFWRSLVNKKPIVVHLTNGGWQYGISKFATVMGEWWPERIPEPEQ
jgi:hypothetical protein